MTISQLYHAGLSITQIAQRLRQSRDSVYKTLLADPLVVLRPRGGKHKKPNAVIRTISDERLFGTRAEALAEELGVHFTTIYKLRKERQQNDNSRIDANH